MHIITTRVPFLLLLPRRLAISLPRYGLHDPTKRTNSTFCIYFLKSLSLLCSKSRFKRRGKCGHNFLLLFSVLYIWKSVMSWLVLCKSLVTFYGKKLLPLLHESKLRSMEKVGRCFAIGSINFNPRLSLFQNFPEFGRKEKKSVKNDAEYIHF